jgi:hypothetical protein
MTQQCPPETTIGDDDAKIAINALKPAQNAQTLVVVLKLRWTGGRNGAMLAAKISLGGGGIFSVSGSHQSQAAPFVGLN